MPCKQLMGLVPAFVALTAFCALPASAATLIATWTGTITSGSLIVNGSSVDSADFVGDTFTLTSTYGDDPSFGLQLIGYTNGNITSLNGLTPSLGFNVRFDGGGGGLTFDLSYESVRAAHITTETADTFSQSGGLSVRDENSITGFVDRLVEGYNLTANVQTPLDLLQGLPMSDVTGSGEIFYCREFAITFGPTQKPLCFDFEVSPTTLVVSSFDAAVPEPATWIMMLLGFGGIGWMLRSHRKTVAT
jgi:hypothetical protein